MAQNAQCSEDGPFFPTTPRYIIQNGMSIEQDILQSPDWVLIAIMCVAVLLTVIIIIIALVSDLNALVLSLIVLIVSLVSDSNGLLLSHILSS